MIMRAASIISEFQGLKKLEKLFKATVCVSLSMKVWQGCPQAGSVTEEIVTKVYIVNTINNTEV